MEQNAITTAQNGFPANYSGITINITNPTMNAPAACSDIKPNLANQGSNPYVQNPLQSEPPVTVSYNGQVPQTSHVQTNEVNSNTAAQSANQQAGALQASSGGETLPQAYPPQYYLNNYNYIQNPKNPVSSEQTASYKTEKEVSPGKVSQEEVSLNKSSAKDVQNPAVTSEQYVNEAADEDNTEISDGIIDKMNARIEEQKEENKNKRESKVVALTNEYIMSLENYLNNPNKDIRIMAAQEVLTRLGEDSARYDDAALNALLNKMIQDPESIVRTAALSAFSSGLASGNDYTVQLLQKIQQNPQSDKQDVLESAQALLRMTTHQETIYTQANPQQ